MMTMMRVVSRTLSVAALIAGSMATVACSAAPDERTSSDEGAMRCRPGTDCGGSGGGAAACDPATSCCWRGGASMGSSACGATLYAAGCRSTRGTGYAYAIATDGPGHWWYEVYCPWSASDAAASAECQAAGIAFNYSGNACTTSAPGAGLVDVAYDPDCPSGCKFDANY